MRVAFALTAVAATIQAPAPPQAPGRPIARKYDPAESRELFDRVDRDSDGVLTYREARFGLGLVRVVFGAWDADGDGVLTFEEYDGRYREWLRIGGAPPSGPTRPAPGPETAGTATTRPAPIRPASTLPAYLRHLDPDGDGRLPIADLLANLPPVTALWMRGFLDGHDADRDGALDALEFAALGLGEAPAPESRPESRPASLPAVVGFLDKDGDGTITLEEVAALAGASRLSLARSLFARADRDSDGRLDAAEAAAFAETLPLESLAKRERP